MPATYTIASLRSSKRESRTPLAYTAFKLKTVVAVLGERRRWIGTLWRCAISVSFLDNSMSSCDPSMSSIIKLAAEEVVKQSFCSTTSTTSRVTSVRFSGPLTSHRATAIPVQLFFSAGNLTLCAYSAVSSFVVDGNRGYDCHSGRFRPKVKNPPKWKRQHVETAVCVLYALP